MNPEQKLELGIEIVAAMKASLYSTPDIEAGRIDALENTEVDRFEVFSYEEFLNLPKERQEHLKNVATKNKEFLHKQALFVAEMAINKLNSFSLFTCKGCKSCISTEYKGKVDEYCYLCCPETTLEECLEPPVKEEEDIDF